AAHIHPVVLYRSLIPPPPCRNSTASSCKHLPRSAHPSASIASANTALSFIQQRQALSFLQPAAPSQSYKPTRQPHVLSSAMPSSSIRESPLPRPSSATNLPDKQRRSTPQSFHVSAPSLSPRHRPAEEEDIFMPAPRKVAPVLFFAKGDDGAPGSHSDSAKSDSHLPFPLIPSPEIVSSSRLSFTRRIPTASRAFSWRPSDNDSQTDDETSQIPPSPSFSIRRHTASVAPMTPALKCSFLEPSDDGCPLVSPPSRPVNRFLAPDGAKAGSEASGDCRSQTEERVFRGRSKSVADVGNQLPYTLI
ncbi:uncharacterized protein BJ171DRAFT_106752, partial [Polychytrium aggregatum]|uniref:uncharacterized protein n=1 Tax=Polychytrium aggregatum TaxID=110093 RepID=UPI0022FF272E